VRNGIIAEYDIGGASSRRSRQPHEQKILDEHHRYCHVYELTGALSFGVIEYLSRRLVQNRPTSQFVILDFRRVPTITKAAARLLADSLGGLTEAETTVVLSGIQSQSSIAVTIGPLIESLSKLRKFAMLDEAIEWAEDQIIYRYGG
jgi:glutaminase